MAQEPWEIQIPEPLSSGPVREIPVRFVDEDEEKT